VSFEKKTKRLEIRISDALKEKLEKAAKRENTKEAKVVRDAIEEKLDKSK
jgi:predicted DNA-binding protein